MTFAEQPICTKVYVKIKSTQKLTMLGIMLERNKYSAPIVMKMKLKKQKKN